VTTFVVLLRSINVGGHNRVAMADLRRVVTDAGFAGVTTNLQSGNVVCRGTGTTVAVAGLLGERIAAGLDVSVPVVVRTGPQLAEVIGGLPGHLHAPDPRTLHVTFLATAPDPGRVEALQSRADEFGDDRFEVVGASVYLHCPSGYGRTTLNNTFVERALGVTATTRNWRTVQALGDMVTAAGGAGADQGTVDAGPE
jgi:uncharacterized protein (DUF1697 family)